MRRAEDHLTPEELMALPLAKGALWMTEFVDPTVGHHLQACEECKELVDAHAAFCQLSESPSSVWIGSEDGCPPTREWLECAAGVRSDLRVALLLHATQCAACEIRWQEAQALMGEPDAADDLETSGEALRSSSIFWQKEMAAQLASSTVSPGVEGTKADRVSVRTFWESVRAFASSHSLALQASMGAAFIAATGVLFFAMHKSELEQANQLIAQAYTEQRTLPFRVPDASYSHIKSTRAGEAIDADRGLPLLEAETKIAHQLENAKASQGWLVASANTAILEGNYKSAIHTLSVYDKTAPAAVHIALATAYFEDSEQGGPLEERMKAVEQIGEAYDEEPHNPVVLFNRALIAEGTALYDVAAAEWNEYLAADDHSEWSREAREHLSFCQQKLRDKSHAVDQHSLLLPQILDDPKAVNTIDDEIDSHIEAYQLLALTSYLPSLMQRQDLAPAEKRSKVRMLERLGRVAATRHNDFMLKALLAHGSGAEAQAPLLLIAEAIAANQTGDEEQAFKKAQQSAQDFDRIGDQAGSLRAQYEMLYAMQFSSRPAECVTLAQRIAGAARLKGYSWLAAAAETESGFCRNMNGDFGKAAEDLALAARDAESSHYPVALDRASVGIAAMQLQSGSTYQTWQIAGDALQHFWSMPLPYDRGASFCDLLGDAAEQQHLYHLETAVLRESLSLLENNGDPLETAQVMTRLAGAEMMLRQVTGAKKDLSRALQTFARAPQTAATRSQELLVRISLAKVEEETGNYSVSVAQLEPLRPELAFVHEDLSIIDFNTVLGESYRKLRRESEAEAADLAAIRTFNTGLASLPSMRDRMTWLREISSAYRSLVQLRIDQKRPNDALQVWQDYRAAGSVQSQNSNAPELTNGTIERGQSPQVTIVYAELPEGSYAWGVRQQQTEFIPLGISVAALTQLGSIFTRECADPSSNMATLGEDGRQLFKVLLKPFSGMLLNARTLLIEPDDELAQIPFGALVGTDGQYLNASHTLAVSPFPARLAPGSAFPATVRAEDRALLVESPVGLSVRQLRDPQSADEIQIVASRFPNNEIMTPRNAARAYFLDRLRSSAVFHYAGHSASSNEGSALILRQVTPKGEVEPVVLKSDDLEGLELRHMKLVVLSACQTDGGEGGRWLDRDNIAVTLLDTGAAEVVASRWNIDSVSTATLMRNFYANLAKGWSVPYALQNASESLRQQAGFAHPYYWAPFSVLERTEMN